MDKVRVLLLAANPAGTPPLKLNEEIRRITAKVRAAEYRDSLELVSRWAVRPNDLLQALLEVKPHVVHFSGHGSSAEELILLNDQGNPKPVSKEALVHLFRILKDNVRVVVLNACYSRPQAEALAQTIDCTVGMNRAIGDEAAIIFAASFYRAVGFGRSVKEAFELGRVALLLEGIPEDKMPELLTRKGVDAVGLVLISPPVAAPRGAEKPAAKGPGERLGVPARLALVRELSGLAPADLAMLVAAIEGAAANVSRHGTVAEKVAELVRWAESSTGPGLGTFERALELLSHPLAGPLPPRGTPAVGRLFWNVPYPRNPTFTGRKDVLSELRKRLTKRGRTALAQVISGLGGIGKTQTAVEYAYRYRDQYQAVLWLNAESPLALKAGCGELARMMQLRHTEGDLDQAVLALKHWLETHSGWLLILDNADDPANLEPFLPAADHGHLLITSRTQDFQDLGVLEPMELPKLPIEEGTEFLIRRCGRQDAQAEERDAARELARELDGLPLALEQAAAYIYETKAPFQHYLESYRSRGLKLLEARWPASGRYPKSVVSTWAATFEAVQAESQAAAAILRFSAFLSPDDIPFELVRRAAADLKTPATVALDGGEEDLLVVHDLLQPLTRFSIVHINKHYDSYSIHRLHQQVIKDAMDEPTRREWTERAIRATSSAFPPVEYSTWPQCERLLPHALTLTSEIKRVGIRVVEAGRLLNQTAAYMYERGQYAEAEPFLRQALEIRRTALGERHPDYVQSLNDLARLYDAMGRHAEAEPLNNVLESNRKIPISLIFPTTGIPTFNYVRPDEYERFRAELQTLGRGLIVEGPSRTGKTTATRKAIEEIAPKATNVWIDSRNQFHIEIMRTIICSDFKGYIFIDDFHHLPEGEQDRVAWAIKQFADRAVPDAKITVIGINRVGYSLMGGLPEISGRVQSISLSKQQHPNKILELIEKGENVANIRFQHKDAIIEASGGSFFIAQQICYHLAVKNKITESQYVTSDIIFEYNWVKTEFLDLIGPTCRLVLNEFAAIDHDGPNPGAALVLLGLLRTEQDHYVLFDEAARQYPHFEPALRWLNSDSVLNERMSRPLGNLRQAKLQDYFYYDSRVGRIDMHDVQLIYYLSNMDWKEFARRAGYSSEIRGNRVKVRRLNQRRLRKPAPHPADMTTSSSKQLPVTNRAAVEQTLPHVTPSGLDPDLATRLVNFLSEISAFSDPANRSILLKGLPKGPSDTISRHPAAWTDLHNIVEAALGMGRLPGRGSLAIHKLLDNSLKFIEGTQHEPELNDLRRLFTA